MKDRLTTRSFRAGMLPALLVAAGLLLSLQGCLPPRGRVIVQAPPLVLPAPPFLYVIPGTYVYFAADVDIFFYQGFWYRPHLGGWYRANEYNGPWDVIVTNRVPLVLREVPQTYRRVPPGSGRLHYNDVRNNWRTWERERHWDRQDERKREQFEERDRDRGDDRDRDKSRDKDKDRDRGRGRDEYRDNKRDPGPPQRDDRRDLNRGGDQDRGQARERDMRQGQERPSAPVRQLTPPEVRQQEKKETPPKMRQDRKKEKDRKKDEEQDNAPSKDRDENGSDERGRGKGRDR
ncbi:MAG TPA: hypothetical protein VN604_09975 [Nitrospirota bacterium]|nr:hypothetical protein [Nitrospirota bacterium]